MHGSNPDTVKEVCEISGSYSEKFGAVIVAPQFTTKYFPGDSYMFGNMLDGKGSIVPKEKWGFSLIEHLFDALCDGLGLTNSAYDIVGFSGGGQFVQRMVLFFPEARFRRAVAGSPGRYAFPTFSNRFPYGLQNSPIKSSDLARIFGRNFILLLGDADIVDRIREDQAQEQGANRFARGLRFFATATEEASNLGTPLRWQIHILHNVDHHPATVVSEAFDLLQ
jgi:pimeloyl-ACP methyl ester carboxylesterase